MGRRVPREARRAGRGGRALLYWTDRFEPWRLLWLGTMRLLESQEPRAFRRITAKLARHGLMAVTPRVEWEGERPRLRIDWEFAGLTFTTGGQLRHPGALRRLQRYAQDRQPITLQGHRRGPPALPLILVLAYYGARWHLTTRPPPGPRLQGDALEDRAVALVARHYGLRPESVRSTIKRARPRLPAEVADWIKQGPDDLWWQVTLGSDTRKGGSRQQGALKR